MVVNESLILQVLQSLNGSSLGFYVNNILLALGGIAGATILYFSIMLYYQHKIYKQHLNEEKKLDDEMFLLLEQYKLSKEIHKLLIEQQQRYSNGRAKSPHTVYSGVPLRGLPRAINHISSTDDTTISTNEPLSESLIKNK